jgi:hypothetical protein
MNEERMSLELIKVMARAAGYPASVALKDARLWVMGVRDARISDFVMIHMPKARDFASQFVRNIGG